MLSQPYREIKRARSIGNCPAAIAMLRARPPSNDEDALEAAVCLLVCGQPEDAAHVCRTYKWELEWARRIAQAFNEMLVGGNDAQALAQARAAIADPAAPCDAHAVYLLLLQKNGLIAEARTHIAAHWQNPPPEETLLLTILAEISCALEDWRQAYRFAAAVLASDPDDLRALISASAASCGDGNFHEALGAALRAQGLSPGFPPVVLQIMRCQNKLGDHYAALGAFEKLAEGPAISAGHCVELARAYAALEHREKAIAAYRRALASDPNSVEALRGLAAIHAAATDTAALATLVQTYRAEVENDTDALYWCGLEALSRGGLDESARAFSRAFSVAEAETPWPVPEPRLRHDYEQLDLLQRRGKLDAAGRAALDVLRPYYARSGDPAATFSPTGADRRALEQALGACFHRPDVPFAQRALGDNDYASIEDQHVAKRLVVIDNFLTREALSVLRAFCEEATVWKSYNRHGYVGALLALGFSPHVLLTLSRELAQALPNVIGGQPLLQAWGYKYDQRMQGINLHADFAKVNVNFWITPDHACEDLSSGGMVVYDLPVPRSWTFADYNTDPARLAAYVKLHGAKPVRVPYRENRCVLFDSSLIHVTDRMRFKDGYENRRVNVTLLYGQGLGIE